MKKTLATIGLFLFPVTGVFCLIAFAMLGLSTHSVNFRPERAIRFVYLYRALLFISVLGFVGSVVVLIRGRR